MFPPGLRQAGDEPLPHRISGGGHHDRDRACGVLGRPDRGGSLCHNHVHLELGQLGRQVAEPFLAPLRITVLNDDVLALDVAELAQPLPERYKRWIGSSGRTTNAKKPADQVHLRRLLRLSRERRHEHTEGESNNTPDSAAPHKLLLSIARIPTFVCHMNEAERWRSAAAGSGSVANAGGRRLQRFVRRCLTRRETRAWPCLEREWCRIDSHPAI